MPNARTPHTPRTAGRVDSSSATRTKDKDALDSPLATNKEGERREHWRVSPVPVWLRAGLMDSADWETAEAAFDAEWEQYERREGKKKMAADAGGSREPTASVATAPKGGSTGFVLDTSGLKKSVVREASSDASAAMGLTEDTASTLAILGVRGASAEALE
eukprot:COSAG01_NODE_15558_length_1323_cov_19.351307_2_plen_160_part_01